VFPRLEAVRQRRKIGPLAGVPGAQAQVRGVQAVVSICYALSLVILRRTLDEATFPLFGVGFILSLILDFAIFSYLAVRLAERVF